ncbi:hypothetical protein NMY22_g8968 [Coprinellus aureogranulatus]|nr:hypothetical protein NMY22_g8968 [Coprinellus aureogranulatus]
MGRARESKKRVAVPPPVDDPPCPTLNRPFRHYPVFPKGPITAEEIGDILIEHKRRFPDVDASTDEESTSGSESESEVETSLELGNDAPHTTFDGRSLEDGDIELAFQVMLGPNYLNILRQHFPIPRCPGSLPLHGQRPVLPAPAVILAPPPAVISSTERVIQESANVEDDANAEPPDLPTNVDRDALPRLRPKSKLKMTERATKVYRND